MTYCLTRELGHCSCLKARVRYCAQCERWICRTLFDAHACYQGTPLYGREQQERRYEARGYFALVAFCVGWTLFIGWLFNH